MTGNGASDIVRQPGVVRLEDGARVAVVGGGPAGTFFAIELLRLARERHRSLQVTIFERKRETGAGDAVCSVKREGCNYCAGIISPLMFDKLEQSGLGLPEQVMDGDLDSLIIQGEWKHFVLDVPAGRRMVVVYRGSRPWGREDRHFNFDAFLLDKAVEAGAEVVSGDVQGMRHTDSGLVEVSFRNRGEGDRAALTLEADFTVLACGVNQIPGMCLDDAPVFSSLQEMIPGFRPPRTRKALIAEVDVRDQLFMDRIRDEVYFTEYGSRDLTIELACLIPKGNFITVVLIGPTVDRSSGGSGNREIVNRFLTLPQIERLLPGGSEAVSACMCNPNMAVGTARNPLGHRVAVVGDMVTSRLYKDGIYSAHSMATALARAALDCGVDRPSLKRGYWPAVREINVDNRFGRVVFLINRLTFSSRILSRVLYQAVIIERKTRPENERRLEKILWRIASGVDSYRRILLSMLHPAALSSMLVGGWLVTFRNVLTERVFGLKWEDFGRYPTAVTRDRVQGKRKELAWFLKLPVLQREPDYEKMYTIRIAAKKEEILRQLGRIGDGDRRFFKPRMIRVRRVRGKANEPGSVIRYAFPFRIPPVDLALEHVVRDRFLIFRVTNGFARGGLLIFDLAARRPEDHLLTVYVAFNFPRGRGLRGFWWLCFRKLFPSFLHDVVWNHSLCRMKDVVERDLDRPSPRKTTEK